MKEGTKCTILSIVVTSVIVLVFVYCFIYALEWETELKEEIKDNLVLSKPFNEIVGVNINFVAGEEGEWLTVSFLLTTDEYPGSPQWIYDFRYEISTDTLYYDGNIEGIGVFNG